MHTDTTSPGETRHFDIAIVGAGPAGLCLAQALKPLGRSVVLVEQHPASSLENPAFDGREIALTQHSVRLLTDLGVWQHLPAADVSPLRDARVLNGPNPFAMTISHRDAPSVRGQAPSELGFLVGNHHIRRAAHSAVFDGPGAPTLLAGQAVERVHTTPDHAHLTLANGQTVTAELLVAADSRHSPTRRALGIAADHHDFGRSMLVCAMTHGQPHHHAAWEWFDHGQTLALLPMNPCPATGMHRSSVVLTLPASEMDAVWALDEPAFNAELQRRFANRLGPMQQASSRHVYPLVAVYPRRLVAHRLACVGDAACGMHPVTAHGFNLGLRSIEALASGLTQAQHHGQDLAHPAVLARYERNHWWASRPTYLATQWVTRLYTQDTGPASLLRDVALHLGQGFAPFRRAVAASLTGA